MKKTNWFVSLTIPFVFTTITAAWAQTPAGIPVFEFDRAKSSIGFNVKASVASVGRRTLPSPCPCEGLCVS